MIHWRVTPSPVAAPLDPALEAARHRQHIQNLIYLGWGLIALKSFLVVWAVQHYRMPFHPMWVIGPTVGFAALVTALYYLMRED